MMSKLWVRHAILLMAVSTISIVVAAGGFAIFGWADDIFVAGNMPAEVEARLIELEATAAPLEAEINVIVDRWFTPEDRARRSILMGGITALCILLSVGMAVVTARWITQPISVAANQLQSLAAGHLEGRVKDQTPQVYGTEIAQLLRDVDKLAETLSEREARIRKDTAIIAHELRTPLTTMISHLHAMRDGVLPMGTTQFETLLHSAGRLGQMIDDLRTLSLADAEQLPLEKTPLDLGSVVAETLGRLEHQFDAADITIKTKLGTAPYVGDAKRLSQAVTCLLTNALSHADGCTQIDIAAQRTSDVATLTIADDGPGFPASLDTKLLFSPFYKGDTSARGSGLGLAIASAIVKMHGGDLTARTGANGGAVFQIDLPLK